MLTFGMGGDPHNKPVDIKWALKIKKIKFKIKTNKIKFIEKTIDINLKAKEDL